MFQRSVSQGKLKRIYPLSRAHSTGFASDSALHSQPSHPRGRDVRRPTSDWTLLQTKPVENAPESLISSPVAFYDYIRSPQAAPLIFRAASERVKHNRRRGLELFKSLRASGNRLVEIEAGRDVEVDEDLRLPHDYRASVALNTYLDWLCGDQGGSPKAPWYLAQWLARDEVPGLAEVVRPPSLLAPLLEESNADLYQTGFFVGPACAMSPLHFDPYENLYTLHASSEPSAHAKHWLLLPPSQGRLLSPRPDPYTQPNMSTLDFQLRYRTSDDAGFDVLVDRASVPGDAAQAVLDATSALSCVMREGDMLFVPRRWWHRVENVVVEDDREYRPGRQAGTHTGWTVGVGWWFLLRAS